MGQHLPPLQELQILRRRMLRLNDRKQSLCPSQKLKNKRMNLCQKQSSKLHHNPKLNLSLIKNPRVILNQKHSKSNLLKRLMKNKTRTSSLLQLL